MGLFSNEKQQKIKLGKGLMGKTEIKAHKCRCNFGFQKNKAVMVNLRAASSCDSSFGVQQKFEKNSQNIQFSWRKFLINV